MKGVFIKLITNEKSYLVRHKHDSKLFVLCDWASHKTIQSYLNKEDLKHNHFKISTFNITFISS